MLTQGNDEKILNSYVLIEFLVLTYIKISKMLELLSHYYQMAYLLRHKIMLRFFSRSSDYVSFDKSFVVSIKNKNVEMIDFFVENGVKYNTFGNICFGFIYPQYIKQHWKLMIMIQLLN